MDATQHIQDSFLEEEDDTDEEEEQGERKKGREPLAKLKVFKNNHIPEMEVPLYLGENILGRDPTSCPVPLQARSISGQHAVISISVFRTNDCHGGNREATEALLWDLGSLNGTRKGRIKLSPHVRYALTEGDSVVLADLPCQYTGIKSGEENVNVDTGTGGRGKEVTKGPAPAGSGSDEGRKRGVENGGTKSMLPPVPVWSDEEKKSLKSPQMTPKQPEKTLVPESDSDSEGERAGRRERRKFLASDSASSDMSSPTCSTFLTPANKVIPESEDESSITPSSPLIARLTKKEDHSVASSDSTRPEPLDFNLGSDTDVEEEEEEEDKIKGKPEVQPVATPQVAPDSPVVVHMESKTDAEGTDTEKAKSEPDVSAGPTTQDTLIPADFTVDSDTDVEEDKPAVPPVNEGSLEKKAEAVSSVSLPGEFHMDSDTDAEDDGLQMKMEISSSEVATPDVRHPSAVFHMDSDTDEEDAEVQKKVSNSEMATSDRPPIKHVAEFHMDSDTDVEDDGAQVTAGDSSPKIETTDVTPPTKPEAVFHMDSDTDVEEAEKSVEGIKLLSVSDTDDEDPFKPKDMRDDTARVVTPIEAKAPLTNQPQPEIQAATENNADTHCDEPADVPPRTDRELSEFRLDSDTDVEEEGIEQRGAETAAGMIKCSTPRGAGLPEEEMETQAFLSPSQTSKRPTPLPLHPSSGSPGPNSPGCDDFVVAETQSFVSQAALDETRPTERDSSFQLSLSDSSVQIETEAQGLGVAEEDWDLQPTQLYASKYLADRERSHEATEKRLDLEATQAYPVEMSEKEEEEQTQPLDGQVHSNLSTAETQLIIRAQEEENNDSEAVGASGKGGGGRGGRAREEEEEEEEVLADSHLSTAETVIIVRSQSREEQTQPFAQIQEIKEEEETQAYPIEELRGEEEEVLREEELSSETGSRRTECDADNAAIAERQPMCEDEEEQQSQNRSSRRPRRGRGVNEEQTKPIDSNPVSHFAVAETQPMCEDEEGQEEEDNSEARSSKRSRKGRKMDKDQTQPIDCHSHEAVAETQPVSEDEERQEEELVNETRSTKRLRGKRQTNKIEATQPLELSADTTVTTELQPVCEDEEDKEEELGSKMRSRRKPRRAREVDEEPTQVDTHTTIAETQPMDDEGQEEESSTESKSCRTPQRGDQTQPVDSDVTVAQTQPVCEDEEEEEKEQPSKSISSRRPRRGRREDKDQTQPTKSDVAVAETQPVCKDEEGQEEEQKSTSRSNRGPRRGRQKDEEQTQPIDGDAHAPVAVAETQPVCEDEDTQKEAPEATSSRRTQRSRMVDKKQTKPLESHADAHVAVAETEPACEDEEEQEKEQRSTTRSSRRPRRGTQVDEEQTQLIPSDADGHVTKTKLVGEDEEGQEEAPRPEPTSSRRSRRSRMVEPSKPLDPVTKPAEPPPMDECVEEPTDLPQKGEGSGRGLRGRGRGRGASVRGRGKAPVGKRKRGTAESEEEGVGEEEEKLVRKGRGRKSMRQKAEGEKKEEREEEEEEEKQLVERGRGEPEKREQFEKQGSERVEQEEGEKAKRERDEETKRKMELEKAEEKERLEKERKETEDIAKREQEEKDRLEQERMKKEKEEKEKEQLEHERKEREETERLVKEKKEQEEQEQIEKEMKDKQEGDKEDKELIEQRQTKRDKKEKAEQVGIGRRQTQGKRKARMEKTTDKEGDDEKEERNGQGESAPSAMPEKEEDKCKPEEGKAADEAKPKRGRRPTRKSMVPTAGVEESKAADLSEDVPARRTRSRSNSSNSVSSEQSVPTMEAQTRGRGRGRGRKPTEEVATNSTKPAGRRRTATAPYSELEDTKQKSTACARSRSNSGSSERSSSSVAAQNRGRGGRGRKSLKVEEKEEEGPSTEAAGRGKGRASKRPKPDHLKVEETPEDQQKTEESETMSTSEDSVLSQASSRGRKRGADNSTLSSESSPVTPKTPRRSLVNHSYKVLFTGVTDEDGEKVVVRLGGGLAKGVGDMTHLVTDKVRRTVKFLCAVARGVPIITPDWLTKSGKAGIFLSPTDYLVKDLEQERKFNFSLQESLRAAGCQPLLRGYEIHVTPSVKPEPSQMKDIITCCGARYLAKMPTAHKPQTVVVSCEEDKALCEKVLSLSVPVVTAEFLLTGILQQKVDLHAHALPVSPAAAPKPAARGRRR